MPALLDVTPKERALPAPSDLYHADCYTWALQQAAALRRGDFEAVDWENVIEEIEDVGKSQKRAWESQCRRLVQHILELKHWQPEDPEVGRGWILSVQNARIEMEDTIDENPGLKSERDEMLRNAWRYGRKLAAIELANYDSGSEEVRGYKEAKRKWMQLIPEACPYTVEQIEDEEWWPEEVRRKFGL